MGLACASARAGDLLCDLFPGRKIVVREDHENNLRLVGTATLPSALLTFANLMRSVRQVLELALQEQHYHDFLQLDCSTDSSTIADHLLNIERTNMSNRIQILSNSILTSEAEQASVTKLTRREGTHSFPKQYIEGIFNIGDLIDLAEERKGFASAESLQWDSYHQD